ncbi:MAG: cytochrome b5-like heme/steroid binding domain-containing protein [Myxococcota bacterium]|nr:cytochrome b5-like heme/steroid binding domain-containing protein [Myxococcota bacterium]
MLSLLSSIALSAQLDHAEVALHDSPQDCWTVIDGQVYDLTEWIPGHPGGDAIERACGKDASHLFAEQEHSEAADAILPTLRIGALGDPVPRVMHPAPHPHSQRLAGARVGLLPSAATGPKGSVALRVGHSLALGDAPSGIDIGVGYSFGRVDLLLTDHRALGLGGLAVKVDLLGDRSPIHFAVQAGGGYATVPELPALYALGIMSRSFLDQRLTASIVHGLAASPGSDQGVTKSSGAGLEFRPIPIHSVFTEVNFAYGVVTSNLQFSAGARIFTRNHAFSVFYANTPTQSPWALTVGGPSGHAVGLAMERALHLR